MVRWETGVGVDGSTGGYTNVVFAAEEANVLGIERLRKALCEGILDISEGAERCSLLEPWEERLQCSPCVRA